MQYLFARRLARFAAAGLLLASLSFVAGCKGDAKLSQQEVQQMKSGPPAEMPAEARASFQKAMQSQVPSAPTQNGP